MAQKPAITLSQAKAKLPPKKDVQASDLMDSERLEKLRQKARESAAKARRAKHRFDEIDALAAEIIARFGYETYERWNEGEIEQEQMVKWLYAERARDKVNLLNLESIIISLVSSCVRYSKGQSKPKGPAQARKIYKEEIKIAKGEM